MSRKNPLAELLERCLRAPDSDPGTVEVTIVHRSPAGDLRHISGSEIDRVGARALHLDDGSDIPYHRLRAVTRRGVLLWRRTPVDPAAGPG